MASAGPTPIPQRPPCTGEHQPGLSTQIWAHKCLIRGKITLFDLLAAIVAIQPCSISNKTGGVLIFRHSLFDCFGMLTDGAAHICCGQSSCSVQRAIPLSTPTAFPLHPTFLGHFHSFFPLTPHFTGCIGSKCCPFLGTMCGCTALPVQRGRERTELCVSAWGLPFHCFTASSKDRCEPWEKYRRISGYKGRGYRIYWIHTGSTGRVGNSQGRLS